MRRVLSLRRIGQYFTRQNPQLTFIEDEDFFNPQFMKSVEDPIMITTYDEDSMTSFLSAFVSPKSLLDAYQQHRKHISINHCILILRIMARFPDLIRPFQQDQAFLQQMQSLMGQINEQMLDMNEIDLIDILFWIRKMVNGSVHHVGPKYLNSNKFHQCIQEKVETKQYSLRYLINVYFDYTFLGKNTDRVAEEMLISLQNPKQTAEINFISALTISKSAVQRMFYSRNQDYPVAKAFLDFALQILGESDLIQQSSLLVDCAKIRWHLQDSHFKLHPVILAIEKNMRNNLDKLQESTVIQILESFVFLPQHHPRNLLHELENIILQTIESKPNQMRIDFLHKLVLPISTLYRRQLLPLRCLTEVLGLLLVRLCTDDILEEKEQKFVDFVLEIVHLKITLNPSLSKYFEQTSKHNRRQISSLFILHKTFKKDIKEELIQINASLIKDPQQFSDMKQDMNNLFLLGLLMEEHNMPIQQIKSILFEQIPQNPIRLLHYTHTFSPTQFIEDIFIQVSISFQRAIIVKTNKSDQLKQIPRNIFNQKTLDIWINWIETNMVLVRRDLIFERFFSCIYNPIDFSDISDFGNRFFLYIFEKFDREITPQLAFIFIRNQPDTFIFMLKNKDNMLSFFIRKFQSYKNGSEFVKLMHLLELHNLHHFINPKDLLLQFHQGFSNVQKFNNQVVYLMIKYYCLPTNQLDLVYNNLVDQNDTELKLLLLMINMFQKIKKSSPELQSMIINQTNKVCSEYDHD